jgi:hypothetical protein
VNITLIFFGWLLVLSSILLAYGTFKRQSRLTIPYIFALFEAVLLVILLEALPEFIDNLGVGWFLLINFLIGMCQLIFNKLLIISDKLTSFSYLFLIY